MDCIISLFNLKLTMMQFNNTISLTFGDRAETHVGMQMLGNPVDLGFSPDFIESLYNRFREKDMVCELVNLHPNLPPGTRDDSDLKANVLIIRNGVFELEGIPANDLYQEVSKLKHDSKFLNPRNGSVQNKNARHNLCFADMAQKADVQNGKGTVIAFDTVPGMNLLRQRIAERISKVLLVAESNLYFDPSKCGIGYHGDTERKIVICIRLGARMPLQYQWFYKWKSVGAPIRLNLDHGDIYIMSEKATGYDWKRSSIYTLRHGAGAEKYMKAKK